MVQLDPSLVDGGGKPTIITGKTTGIGIEKYLNRMVTEKIDSVPWEFPENISVSYNTPPETNNYAFTIKQWNSAAKRLKDFLSDSNYQDDFTGVTYMFEDTEYPAPKLGDEPPLLDDSALQKALKNGSEKEFKAFKNKLKQHKKLANDYARFEKNAEGAIPNYQVYTLPVTQNLFGNNTLHTKWITHMGYFYDHLDAIWEEFGQSILDNNNEKTIDDWLKKGIPGVTEYTDGSLVITEPNVTVPAKVADAATWLYFVPQAKDVNSVLSGRYNPPPHRSTKPLSPTAFTSFKGGDKKNLTTTTPDQNTTVRNRLGFFYQDAANANRKSGKNLSLKMDQLWGFQFMYNPTSFSYTQSSDPNIDWTGYGGTEGDTSNILFGQGQGTITLYLNRIIDLNVLQNMLPGDNSTTVGYPRALSQEDIIGLKTRGTEYDLEFLYRTLNGDPQVSPVMKNGQTTSDWGVIYGIPVWLRLHDNFRWKVVISSLSVNHVMFTADMIPILSEVTIGVTRIPVMSFDPDIEKRYYDILAQDTTSSDNTQQ